MRWIEQNRGIVPMKFEMLVETVVQDCEIRAAIDKLLCDKQQGFESAYMPKGNLTLILILANGCLWPEADTNLFRVELDYHVRTHRPASPFFLPAALPEHGKAHHHHKQYSARHCPSAYLAAVLPFPTKACHE